MTAMITEMASNTAAASILMPVLKEMVRVAYVLQCGTKSVGKHIVMLSVSSKCDFEWDSNETIISFRLVIFYFWIKQTTADESESLFA